MTEDQYISVQNHARYRDIKTILLECIEPDNSLALHHYCVARKAIVELECINQEKIPELIDMAAKESQ